MTTGKKILTGCGIAAATVFALGLAVLMVLGVLVEIKIIPDSEALRKGEIPKRQLIKLEEMGVIEPGEEVLFFYSGGILSIEADGNLFTDKRVISYETLEGELDLYSASYPEILSIKRESSGSLLEDTVIEVETEEDWFYLLVSAEGGRDQEFEDELIAIWEKERGGNGVNGEASTLDDSADRK